MVQVKWHFNRGRQLDVTDQSCYYFFVIISPLKKAVEGQETCSAALKTVKVQTGTLCLNKIPSVMKFKQH